ncbi:MAG: hypothetical protein FJ405_15220 [Verrucomicrobia bacterium]|nr:hypothetical protein [Verrucomicrobiota bacterium]
MKTTELQGRSARGGALRLETDIGLEVARISYPGNPSLAQQYLRITELMFTPPVLPGDAFKPDEYEFIELSNTSANTPLDLTGVHFTRGLSFSFIGPAAITLAPGKRIVVAKNPEAFKARYGTSIPVLGPYLGNLENGRETIALNDAHGEKVLEFSYSNKWYPITDGLGFSLVIQTENGPWDTWGLANSWRVSSRTLGSPGSPDDLPPALPRVVVNEILSAPSAGKPQAIELYNPPGLPAALDGWYLTDDLRNPKKYQFSKGTSLAGAGFLSVTGNSFGSGGNAFKLSRNGEEVWLFSGDPITGELTGYLQGSRFGAVDEGTTIGRFVDSVGHDHFVAQDRSSLGLENGKPRVGPLLISEVHFHPAVPPGAAEEAFEFIELHNVTSASIALGSAPQAGHGWTLRGDVDFDLPTNAVVPAHGFLLLVGFDPKQDPDSGERFRRAYSLDRSLPLLGPCRGRLRNSSGHLTLNRPLTGATTNGYWMVVDEVTYSDSPPWPGGDGDGASLQRLGEESFGNDPASWTAARPLPASGTVRGQPPVFEVEPASREAVAFQDVEFTGRASGVEPLRYQWRYNGAVLPGETNASLRLPQVHPSRFGLYQVTAYNSAGSRHSSVARLTLKLPAFVTQQPQGRLLKVGTNVSLSVSAVGNGELTYQWRLNGQPLAGEHSSVLQLRNVQLSQAGRYDVEVGDSVGVVLSNPAQISVLEPPGILEPPDNVNVVVGQTIMLQVAPSGSQPFGYRWRRGSTPLNGATNLLLQIGNAQVANAGNYTVVVTNLVGSVTSRVAVVSVLVDADKDGIPDNWENANELDPGNPADALMDPDGDGVINRDEFVAGTNPKQRASYLHLERPEVVLLGDGLTAVIISFEAMSNHTYVIESTSDVAVKAWVDRWTFAARPTNGLVVVTNVLGTQDRAYFRVQTPRLR